MRRIAAPAVLVAACWQTAGGANPPLPLEPELERSEAARVALVAELSRATVAIFERRGENGGSGVVVSEEGLVVTNFHVTAPCGPRLLVGTSDGRLHDAVIVGSDPTGDIALVRLLGPGPFASAPWGDSDRVRVGDPAIVAGNPFLLAHDFTPTVTFGVVSGVRRYQYPAGTLLEYADCLQTDAAINPGNSGGPVFDGAGQLVGIAGRGSFEKRGRVNVGVGYAVSVNQVRRFLSHLQTGRIVDHAALGATVVTRRGPQAIVTAVEAGSDVYRRGLRPGDEVVSLDGRDTPTANALLNAVGVLPAGWRAALEYRREGRLYSASVRLGPLHRAGELEEAVAGESPVDPSAPPVTEDDDYKSRVGYANYAEARRATDALLARCRTGDDASPVLRRSYRDGSGRAVAIRITPEGVRWRSAIGEFDCDVTKDLGRQAAPPEAPAMLAALWVWSRLAAGEEGLLDHVGAYGRVPWVAGQPPHDVLESVHRGVHVEVFLNPETGQAVGLEASRDVSEDPVRVEFTSRDAPPEPLPRAFTASVGDRTIGDWTEPSTDASGDGSPQEETP